jgi:hypothetical protein
MDTYLQQVFLTMRKKIPEIMMNTNFDNMYLQKPVTVFDEVRQAFSKPIK